MTEQIPDRSPPRLQSSGTYTPDVMQEIQEKAELGRYRIRGFGTLRERRWATFDDLTFLPCTLTRIPRTHDGRSPNILPLDGAHRGRRTWPPGHLYAQTVCQSYRQWRPLPHESLGCG